MLSKLLRRADPADKARNSARRKFLYYFQNGYTDPKYISWERQYKLDAHIQFREQLNETAYTKMINNGEFEKIALLAVRIESKTNLLFSFEKMALRDAVKTREGARLFTIGLFDYVYGKEDIQKRFESFVQVVGSLPRKQTRVLTWPLVTVFGFIANPSEHIFLKPRVTQVAAAKYRFEFNYKSRPNWQTYESLLIFARDIWNHTKEYKPRDLIDIQSFIWVLGSEEYPD